MRLWVKPDTLAKLGITVPEIISAIQAQNTVNPAGRAGGEPAPKGQEFTYTVLAQGRLISPEEFGKIVVRETPDGGIVRVRDVARMELGSQDYSVAGRFNGRPGAIIAAYQLPGSNGVEAAAGVKRLMSEMKQRFPEDMDSAVSLDTTLSVTEGIKEIVKTLAIALVPCNPRGLSLPSELALYLDSAPCRSRLSCGDLRTLPALWFFHQHAFSFWSRASHRSRGRRRHRRGRGRERHIEDGLTPKNAALKAMEELSGPVLGIALVLSAVFVPTAFIPGITGRLYQQFAVTIAISVILSAFNALTLSPALAALLLRPRQPSRGLLRRFLDWFNPFLQAKASSRHASRWWLFFVRNHSPQKGAALTWKFHPLLRPAKRKMLRFASPSWCLPSRTRHITSKRFFIGWRMCGGCRFALGLELHKPDGVSPIH